MHMLKESELALELESGSIISLITPGTHRRLRFGPRLTTLRTFLLCIMTSICPESDSWKSNTANG